MTNMVTVIMFKLIPALCMVESHNDASAVGDNGRAVGVLQMHEIMIDEANRLVGCDWFKYEDRRDMHRSREIARVVIMKRLAHRLTQGRMTHDEQIEYCIGLWNRGPTYRNKVLKEMEAMP